MERAGGSHGRTGRNHGKTGGSGRDRGKREKEKDHTGAEEPEKQSTGQETAEKGKAGANKEEEVKQATAGVEQVEPPEPTEAEQEVAAAEPVDEKEVEQERNIVMPSRVQVRVNSCTGGETAGESHTGYDPNLVRVKVGTPGFEGIDEVEEVEEVETETGVATAFQGAQVEVGEARTPGRPGHSGYQVAGGSGEDPEYHWRD